MNIETQPVLDPDAAGYARRILRGGLGKR
jgi:hypothetical protein